MEEALMTDTEITERRGIRASLRKSHLQLHHFTFLAETSAHHK